MFTQLPPRSEHCALHPAESVPKKVPQACALAVAATERVAKRRVLNCIFETCIEDDWIECLVQVDSEDVEKEEDWGNYCMSICRQTDGVRKCISREAVPTDVVINSKAPQFLHITPRNCISTSKARILEQ